MTRSQRHQRAVLGALFRAPAHARHRRTRLRALGNTTRARALRVLVDDGLATQRWASSSASRAPLCVLPGAQHHLVDGGLLEPSRDWRSARGRRLSPGHGHDHGYAVVRAARRRQPRPDPRARRAREQLKDVSIEIPKRRPTVLSQHLRLGQEPLVFGTIAAESQRLIINETYSAFVQGFMPTTARPEVDVLEGLTTAISVDQERRGPTQLDGRHRHRRRRDAAHPFPSRLAKPRPAARRVLLQRRLEKTSGGSTSSARTRRRREGELQPHRRHVPALRGPGLGQRLRPVRAL